MAGEIPSIAERDKEYRTFVWKLFTGVCVQVLTGNMHSISGTRPLGH